MFDDRRQRSAITDDDWFLGASDAPITLLEYGDFECPYCAQARPVLQGLVHEAPEIIRLVFRHFPVSTAHPHALRAAEASEAAGAQGEFWGMHDKLYSHQDALGLEALIGYAAELGLDLPTFDQALASHVYLPEVRRDFRRGIEDGVNGTPSIFINGLRYDGPRERLALRAAIRAIGPARDWQARRP